MNILHTVFSFNNGGIENLLVDIINNWNFNEDNIILCVINNDYKLELLEKIKRNYNIKIILLNRDKKTNNLKVLSEYINLVLKNKIDVIHCHLYEAIKVSILAKLIKPRIKLFYTVHDKKIYNRFRRNDIIIQNCFVERIIAISNSVKEDIVIRNKKNDIDTLANAIDFEKFRVKKTEHDSLRVGCVARIMPEKKGQDILLRAIKIVKKTYPNIECWIAGEPKNGDEKSLVELKKLAEELDIVENVIFKGNVDNIPEFLSEINIFVLPSRYEGFGIAIIEAMASRIPVIASNIEGPKEIIGDSKYGDLFEVEDYKALAKLIIKQIEEPNKDKVDKSYNNAIRKFDIKVMNNSLRNIYNEGIKKYV